MRAISGGDGLPARRFRVANGHGLAGELEAAKNFRSRQPGQHLPLLPKFLYTLRFGLFAGSHRWAFGMGMS